MLPFEAPPENKLPSRIYLSHRNARIREKHEGVDIHYLVPLIDRLHLTCPQQLSLPSRYHQSACRLRSPDRPIGLFFFPEITHCADAIDFTIQKPLNEFLDHLGM